MARKDILSITKEVISLLQDKQKYSIRSISTELNIRWETVLKSLEFLKENGLVKESEGKKTYKKERLFNLKINF